MKKHITYIVFFIVNLILVSCSTQSNSLINKGYHQLTTKYNVLFNGQEALNKGVQELYVSGHDDFDELLSIEPIGGRKEQAPNLEEDSSDMGDSAFDLAEEKAVKAVQRHSMYIKGNERNNQMDDAYLLLGKSRYYNQRFVPALEAFDFILMQNPDSDLSDELKIWKGKTQIRLQNETQGMKELNEVLQKQDLKSDMIEQAHTALAMSYLAINDYRIATVHLEKAVQVIGNREQHARNLFVLAQLHEKSGKRDSAIATYRTVTRFKRVSHKYKVNAYLKLAELDKDEQARALYVKQFKRILKDPLSKSYRDKVYYGLGLLMTRQGNEADALAYLHRSVSAKSANANQKVLAYKQLGDYYFDRSQFVKAGQYYDSLAPFIKQDNSKEIRQLMRKQRSLKDVVSHENLIAYNDSIMELVNMDLPARKQYFKAVIKRQKEADDIENQNTNTGNAFAGTIGSNHSKRNQDNADTWYFYNAQAVGYGKSEFQLVWGNRPLKDNWRWSQQTLTSNVDFDANEADQASQDLKQNQYNLDYYLQSVPSNPEIVNKLKSETAEANYQLGLIYKEKFKAYELSKLRFERFLSENPPQKQVLPAQYHLYRVYKALNDSKAKQFKAKILNTYPDSRYAQLIQNKTSVAEVKNVEEPEQHYANVYKQYQSEDYKAVIEQCHEAISNYPNHPTQAKFELLKAYSLYRIEGETSFKKNLDYIILNYPNTEESQHAQAVLSRLSGIPNPKNTQTEKEKRAQVLELMKQKAPPSNNEKP